MTVPMQYPQGPYIAAPQPIRPKMNPKIKVLAMLVVLIMVLGFVSCAVLISLDPVIFPDKFLGKGEQIFQGIPNGTLLMYKLNVNGFNPQLETGVTEVRVYFSPYCGAMNSTEAIRSLSLMGKSYLYFDHGNNTTMTRIATREFVNSEYVSHNVSGTLRCILEKTKAIFTTELGLKLLSDDISKVQHFMPGFEASLLVPAMVVISLIWRRKMKA
jgi:hypothetical protein